MKWTETVDLGRTEIGVIGDPKVISGATPKSSVDLGFVTKFRQNLPPGFRQNLRVAEVLIKSISNDLRYSSVEFKFTVPRGKSCNGQVL